MAKLSDKGGFTLIEIVTVIVVLSILGGFTFAFFNHASTTYLTGSKQTKLFQDATYTMERVTQELKDSYEVYLDNNGDWIWFYKTNTSGQRDTNDLVYYYKSGTSLYRWTNWTARLICDKVSQFTVSRSTSACNSSYPDCMITIDLVLEDPTVKIGNPPTNVSVSINTSVSPKNFESGWGGRSYNGYYYDIVE